MDRSLIIQDQLDQLGILHRQLNGSVNIKDAAYYNEQLGQLKKLVDFMEHLK